MTKLQENNMANTHLIVGSLEVISDISGNGIKSIQRDVESLQNDQRQLNLKQENYWSNLSSDGIITPYEKKILLKEFREIEKSYNALFTQASLQNLTGTPEWISYTQSLYGGNNVEGLKPYLYTNLKLFNDMESETAISNRDYFDKMFSDYYYEEKFVTIELTTGIMGNLGFRVLTSLSESGTEGEIGLYKGTVYQYTNGKWEAVGLEGYLGARDSLPNGVLNQYFIVTEDFLVSQELWINNENLLVNDDNFYINQVFDKGYIYSYDNQFWVKITDKSDYRYVVAMVDLVTITGELPGVFQEAIDEASDKLKKEIDDTKEKLQQTTDTANSTKSALDQEIEMRRGLYTVDSSGNLVIIDEGLKETLLKADSSIQHIPEYLGSVLSPAGTQPKEGDYLVYKGETIGTWIKGDMYQYKSGNWVHLDPSDTTKRNYYMQGLDDILSIANLGNASFSSVFANNIWAHGITADTVLSKGISIQQGGHIASAQYSAAEKKGFNVSADGEIKAYNNAYIGGNVEITGDVTIGSAEKPATLYMNTSSKFAGELSNAKGSIGTSDNPVAGYFNGDVVTNGNLKVTGTTELSGNVTIGTAAQPATLHMKGDGEFNGNGKFTGDVETAGNLRVTGNTELSGTVNIGGDVTVGTKEKAAKGYFSGPLFFPPVEIKAGENKWFELFLAFDTNRYVQPLGNKPYAYIFTCTFAFQALVKHMVPRIDPGFDLTVYIYEKERFNDLSSWSYVTQLDFMQVKNVSFKENYIYKIGYASSELPYGMLDGSSIIFFIDQDPNMYQSFILKNIIMSNLEPSAAF